MKQLSHILENIFKKSMRKERNVLGMSTLIPHSSGFCGINNKIRCT
jgi:hypothetical protein